MPFTTAEALFILQAIQAAAPGADLAGLQPCDSLCSPFFQYLRRHLVVAGQDNPDAQMDPIDDQPFGRWNPACGTTKKDRLDGRSPPHRASRRWGGEEQIDPSTVLDAPPRIVSPADA